MTKRLIAMLLSVVLVFSLMPVGAVAESAQTPEQCKHVTENWTAWGKGTGESTSLPNTGTIYLTEDITLKAAVSMTAASHKLSICLNGHTITDDDTVSPDYRLFRISGGAKLKLCNCGANGGISNVSSGSFGGAVAYIEGSTVEVENVNFHGNQTTDAGGLFRVVSGSTLKMTGCNVTGVVKDGVVQQAANRAGAMVVGSYSNATLTNCTFQNLKVNADGGAIMVEGTDPQLTLDNVTVENNIAATGGGVRVYKGQLTLKNQVIIRNNKNASNVATNLHLDSEDSKTVITKDMASTSHVCVTMASGKSVVSTDATAVAATTIHSDVSGKVLQLDGNQLTVITPAADPAAHTDTATYTACGHKGAEEADREVYAPWYSTTSLPTKSGHYYLTGNVNLASAVTYNYAIDLTICLNGQNITAASNTRMFRLSNGAKVKICDCSAHYADEVVDGQNVKVFKAGKLQGGNNNNHGGLVWMNKEAADTNGNPELGLYDIIVTNNRSTGDGGAVYAMNSTVNLKGVHFTDNHADNGGGGALALGTGTTATLTGVTLTGNSAKSGGAIIVQGTEPNVTLDNVTVENNIAATGGGVRVYKGQVTLKNQVIIRNNKTSANVATNLHLDSADDKTISTKDMASTSHVSVTMASGKSVVSADATAVAATTIFSDVSGKALQLNGNQLTVITPAANPAAHANTATYTACGHKGAAEADQKVYTPWYSTTSLPTNAGHYYLTADVTVSAHQLFTGADVVICLNGKTIKTANGANYRIFRVSGGTVDICDCTASYKPVTVDGKTINAYHAGKITGGNTAEGPAIWVNGANATVNLHDAVITGNTSASTSSKGIICVVAGTFNMSGGYITDNTSVHAIAYTHGGSAEFNMTGGSIGGAIYVSDTEVKTGNTTTVAATTAGAGALYMNNGTVNLSGGQITGHSIRGLFQNAGKTTISGSALISNNASATNGGGVRIQAGEFSMTGGEISGNTVTGNSGGGLALMGGQAVTISGGKIINNTATGNAGGILLQNPAGLTISGGEITGNTANKTGNVGGNGAGIWALNTSLVISNAKIENNTAQVDGGGIFANGTKVVFQEGTISGNTATNGAGGAIVAKNNETKDSNGNVTSTVEATLKISGGKISGNTSKNEGAGIRMENANFTMTGGEISDNKTTGEASGGAGVRTYGGTITGGKISGNEGVSGAGLLAMGDMTLSNLELTGNKSSGNGGGMYVGNGAKVTVTDCTISENTAVKGAGAYIGKGELTVNGGTIKNNAASSESGAVGMTVGTVTCNLNDVTVSGNSATNGGAFIAGSGNILQITGGTVTGNKAETSGGAIVVQGTGKAILKDVTLTGNSAKAGGAIRYNKGSLTVSGKTVIKDNTLLDGKTASNVQIDSADGSAMVIQDLDKAALIGVTMAAGKTLAVQSGARKANEANFTSDKTGYIFRLTATGGLELFCPAADPTDHANTEGYTCAGHGDSKVQWTLWDSANTLPTKSGYYALAGNVKPETYAVLNSDVEIVLCLNGKTIDCSDATRAYRLSQGAKLTICDCTATTDKDGNYIAGMITGATKTAILIGNEQPSAKLDLYDGIFTGNTVETSGAAIVAQGGAEVNMYGGKIANNEAVQNGAGVYNSGATFNMYGGTICDNTAGKEAGGVYNAGATFLLDGGIISGNKGASNAGVVIGKESKGTIKSGKITGNVSEGPTGGMVIQSKGYVEMSGGEISGNQSKAKGSGGGGVYISASGGTLVMTGGKISGNKAAGYGGGLYIADKFEFKGGSISGNFSAKEGGGMYITDGTVTMHSGSISNNNTDVNGGGVCVRGSKGVFKLYGGTISDNTALNTKSGTGHCGGVLAQGKGTFLMYGGTISGNKCTSMGGGVRVASNSVFNMYDGVITENHSYRGGGVYTDCDMIFEGGQIIKNTCEYEGAGLYVSGGHLEMSGGKVSENENQKGNGGGICLRAKATMNMTGGEVSNNKAALGNGGGVLIQSEASLTMEDGVISGNYASKSGGGIRSSRCPVYILGGSVINNTSDLMGGAIYGESLLVLKDCDISGNMVTAAVQGTAAGAAIKLANFTIMEAENVTFSKNTIVGRGAACDVAYRADASFKGCTFTENSATGNGGAINAMLICDVSLSDCNFTGNSAIGMGGVLCAQSQSKWTVDNCTFTGNMSTISGGVLYGDAKSQVNMTGCTLTGNNATKEGSAISTNGGLYLTDTTITGNSVLGNGSAVVLSGLGGDTESYLPGVNQFKGNVVISDNAGGDLLLKDNAFVNIHGDGLSENAIIRVSYPTGGITKCIVGPYDYVREGDIYTLSKGEKSLSQPDPVTEVAEPEATEPEGTEQTTGKTGVVIFVGSIVVVAAALWIIAMITWKKRKHVAKKIAADGAEAMQNEKK